MTLDQAIDHACSSVGIMPPRGRIDMNKWVKADVIGKGASGKGDGRIICDDARATAHNWITGESVTVWLDANRSPEEKRRYAERRQDEQRRQRDRAIGAAKAAEAIVAAARSGTHPYLARKGFESDRPLIIGADDVRRLAGYSNRHGQIVPANYLVPEGGQTAVVVPARIGNRLASCQLIWGDGTKKFLAGGEMGGASHRIAAGVETWLCEGFATGLSIRAALRGLSRQDTVLVCFSASNVAKVAPLIKGRCFIATDNDKPLEHLGGLGTGEHYARRAGKPYAMPPEVETDFNDFHQDQGIFAVQRILADLIRGAAMS